MTTDRISEQPAPTPTDATPTWELVIADCRRHDRFEFDPAWKAMVADMDARNAEGVRKYGVPLTPHNGRDSLVDAFQESLDKLAYLANAISEAGTAPVSDRLDDLYFREVYSCRDIRQLLLERDGE